MYLKIKDGVVDTYPYSLAALRRDHPDVSFPKDLTANMLADFGVVWLVDTPRTAVTASQRAIEGAPALIDGAWTRTWNVRDATEAELAEQNAQAREAAKVARAEAVEAILVTTAAGNTFNGDETSQGRMSRAILAMQFAGVTGTSWVLANNIPTEVTLAELNEALMLAGAEQTRVWVIQNAPSGPP